jgi:hypothetical protein
MSRMPVSRTVVRSSSPYRRKKSNCAPDHEQHGEAADERNRAEHRFQQVGRRLRHLERNDEQRDGEAEDGVAQPLDARDAFAAPAEGLAFGADGTRLAEAIGEQTEKHPGAR